MREIPLTRGFVAVVDDADYRRISAFKWCAQVINGAVYAARRDGGRYLYMHRVILNAPRGVQVDHRKGNTLDNRKSKLRLCSPRNNLRAFKRKRAGASSKYRGVSWFARDSLWHARIKTADRQIHLGYFLSEEAAARAYDTTARKHFKTFAALNFP